MGGRSTATLSHADKRACTVLWNRNLLQSFVEAEAPSQVMQRFLQAFISCLQSTLSTISPDDKSTTSDAAQTRRRSVAIGIPDNSAGVAIGIPDNSAGVAIGVPVAVSASEPDRVNQLYPQP